MTTTPAPGRVVRAPGGGAARRAATLEQRLADERQLLARTQERISRLERQVRNWHAGAEGERRVASVLDELTDEGWSVLHDVHWPGRSRANLDHVAVGPGGVVVVDAKNWSHEATVSDGVLRAGGHRKDAECEAAARMAADVAALLHAEHRSSVRAVLCLVGAASSTGTTRSGAEVLHLDQLAAWARSRPVALDPGAVHLVARHLDRQLADSSFVTGARQPPDRAPRRAARSARRRPSTGGQLARAVLRLGLAGGAALAASAWLRALG